MSAPMDSLDVNAAVGGESYSPLWQRRVHRGGFNARVIPQEARAEIRIFESIGAYWGGVTAQDVQETLDEIGDVDQIDILMNSGGGEVFDGITIYNILDRHPSTKNVHILGVAASAASLIAMIGSRIIMAKDAMMMIHRAWGNATGTSKLLRMKADILDMMTENAIETYASRSKQPVEVVRGWVEAETWMDAESAMSRGFADEVGVEQKVVADPQAQAILAQYHNTPASLRHQADTRTARLAESAAYLERYRDRSARIAATEEYLQRFRRRAERAA